MRWCALFCLFVTRIPLVAQWQLQDTHTTADLRGIAYVGNGVAWASGTNGTVLRTEDMGKTWQQCTTPSGAENLDFRGIQAFDKYTAVVMSSGRGDLSRLYETVDGCQTWKLVLTNPDKEGFWDALSINAPDHDVLGHPLDHSHARGYVLGDPLRGFFSLFATYDGGSTWSRRVASKRGPKGEGCKIDDFVAKRNEAVFAASNESLITLNSGYLLFVTGGAVTRLGYTNLFSMDGDFCHESTHFIDLPLVHNSESSGAFAMAALPGYESYGNFPDQVMVVGGDYKLPDATGLNVARVDRVGTFLFTRVRKATISPQGYRSAVAYDKGHSAWITVGPNGTDISTDGGLNWRPLKPSLQDPPDANQHWNSLSLPFAVGAHGRVGKLEDLAIPSRLQH